MRLIKSALCILVIFALAVSLVPTTASASALSVVGTSFSSAGLTSAEFAASAGPYAIGILAALAAAYGIKTFTQSETGQAVKEYFGDLIEERAAATRRSVAEEMEVLLGNATIGEQGNIVLGRLSYAEAKAILLNETIPVEPPEETITLGSFKFGNCLSYLFVYPATGDTFSIYAESLSSPVNHMTFWSPQAKDLVFVYPDDTDLINNKFDIYLKDLSNGETYHDIATQYTTVNIGNKVYGVRIYRVGIYECENAPTNNVGEFIAGDYSQDDLIINYPTDTLYGVDETLRDQNVGLNEGLVLAPDLINSAVLGGATGQISASDYCGALVDYVSGYDTVIDGVTVAGLPEAGTVPRSIDEAPTSDTVIDEAPPSTMTGTEAAGLYAFSLDELFPFCLPFDFVRIIEKFNVEPEAPNFDWRFYIPGVIDYTLHIDLSAWNTAAEVCRTMVLIAFMVGLIMLTRQIFIRA